MESGIVEMEMTAEKVVELRIHPVRTNRSGQPQCDEPGESSRVELELSESGCTFPESELSNYSYYVKAFKTHAYLNAKKLIYFLLHLPLGATRLKFAFLYHKILYRIRRPRMHP